MARPALLVMTGDQLHWIDPTSRYDPSFMSPCNAWPAKAISVNFHTS
jgi:hypothetical protein